MHLTPRELDKLVLHGAGLLAQKRLARGLRLNYPEAVALIATQLLELIRDGRGVAELMDLGRRMLGQRAGDGGRARADRRGAGRGDVPGRHQARHRAPPDRARATATSSSRSTAASCPCPPLERFAAADAASIPAEVRSRRPASRSSSTPAARRVALDVVQPRRSADPGRQPLSLRRDQPRARVRPRRGAPACASTSPRAPPCASSRARQDGRARCRRRSTHGEEAARVSRHDRSARPLRRHVRPDHRRPRAARRHRRSSPRSSATSTTYGDECKFGGGKVLRDAHGPGGGRRRRRRARLRDHQRADRRLDRHLQGRHRHQARPHRRHRQGGQPRRHGRRHARAWSSASPPRRSPARG